MLTPLEAFYSAVKQHKNEIYLRQPSNGLFTEYSWGKVAEIATNIAYQLQQQGVVPGDRVAIWSKNCAQWIMSDLAIMMAGAVSVPLYPGQSKESVEYVLQHSGCKLIFVGKHDNQQDVIDTIPSGLPVVAFPYYSGPAQFSWQQWQDTASPESFLASEPKLTDIMTLVYTSGTTGKPKGAAHTFGAYAFAANNFIEQVGLNVQDRAISFLPLAHVAERMIIEGQSLYGWFSISFVESLDSFARDITNIRPTLFFAVPRLWSKFQESILQKVGGQKKLSRLLNVPVVGRLIKAKIRKGLGLDQAKLCGSGASPIPRSLIEWFDGLGIQIMEGYGMTENLCYGTINLPGARKVGSVGKPFFQNEMKISDAGEVLFKSKALMREYYLSAEQSAQAIVDGYYHTGDKGRIDEDGFLFITGRVKELFKTSKGKYIAPSAIESVLLAHEFIEQACVMGSGRPQPVAVLELSETAKGHDKAEIARQLTEFLTQVNDKLEHHERISQFILATRPWTVESGFITPTLKVRREAVETSFLGLADEQENLICWQHADEAPVN